MSATKLSRRAVAAAFLERQWLDRPRGRRLTERTLPEFVSRTCGLQIDSVNVLDRAHHLTLWSRFGEYDRARLERLTYRKRCSNTSRTSPASSPHATCRSTRRRWTTRPRASMRATAAGAGRTAS
jgi:uncharacterized protein YcaQ